MVTIEDLLTPFPTKVISAGQGQLVKLFRDRFEEKGGDHVNDVNFVNIVKSFTYTYKKSRSGTKRKSSRKLNYYLK